MYRITHHFLALDENGTTIVATEERTDVEIHDVYRIVDQMIQFPGGAAGSTICITVGLTEVIKL
jgi:hypothetical protein